jgi:hypothetical protein
MASNYDMKLNPGTLFKGDETHVDALLPRKQYKMQRLKQLILENPAIESKPS